MTPAAGFILFLGDDRPRKYGYFLVVWGLVVILFVFLGPDHTLYWYYVIVSVPFALLAIASGLKLVMKPRNLRDRSRKSPLK
jgi:peptidoglycan/LPS O-acetylase OafA/YrhL